MTSKEEKKRKTPGRIAAPAFLDAARSPKGKHSRDDRQGGLYQLRPGVQRRRWDAWAAV